MKRVIKALLLLAMMALIFYFSSQPSDDSTIATNGVMKILYQIYNFILSGKGKDFISFNDLYFKPVRKLAHFSEFGLLGLLTYINSKEYFNSHNVIYSILFAGLYAVSDEAHQLFVPGRYCAIGDMLIDISGATLAILLLHLISKKCLKD